MFVSLFSLTECKNIYVFFSFNFIDKIFLPENFVRIRKGDYTMEQIWENRVDDVKLPYSEPKSFPVFIMQGFVS